MSLKNKILVVVLFVSLTAQAQLDQYDFMRRVNQPTANWHRIELPDDIFGKLAPDFSDIRIYGVSEKDTVEAPYMLHVYKERSIEDEVAFTIINRATSQRGSFFTFDVPVKGTLNQFQLNFGNANFDWRISLEGSQDLKEWFTILEDYRILSIQNTNTKFQFTTLNFPAAKFRYYRVFIPGKDVPVLLAAKLASKLVVPGKQKRYTIAHQTNAVQKDSHETIVAIELKEAVPIDQLYLHVSNTFDYYRPVTIEYLADSFKTEKEWHFNYKPLTISTVNSIDRKPFYFGSTITKKIRVTINNQNNPPLTVDSVEIFGSQYELRVRFDQPAEYFLAYGNKNAHAPQYDIERFTENIPEDLMMLGLDKEEPIVHQESMIHPLFENKWWLWVILLLIAGLLGFFSIRMMKKT